MHKIFITYYVQQSRCFIRDYDPTKFLVLFGPGKCDAIFDRIRYFIELQFITYVNSFNYIKIKTDSNDNLPVDKILAMLNVVILIKSVF